MNEFERRIGETFDQIEGVGLAHLSWMYPPMKPAGRIGRVPTFVQIGKGDYDVIGYYLATGQCIGAELKESGERLTSIPIRKKEGRGSGLQFHQLDRLAQLARAGGRAVLVWNNGGEVGTITNPIIIERYDAYRLSLKAEDRKQRVANGARSIPWGRFTPVRTGMNDAPLWLPGLEEYQG